ncbi:phenylacetate--CoA ligase [Elstera cyanobacteriorum]|uniref:AMP-dependent synthetase n=1 Tax=Elstera cyanobacteriorum TaxID=2022747 RepID=A0A255XIQ7_9PROT|nr:AMP-binding protein [Elstera cyanobacteriorum]OYQ16859.1 AMP-dependent synthetase [Elstera cyanobacteriorum]GFZ89079.1 phenylacetate--CoA ligase [Elstera cyanobacteriorum]
MTQFFDALETDAPDTRAARLYGQLPGLITAAKAKAPAFARALAGVEAGVVTDAAALARLPLIRKSDLIAAQAADLPFAGLVTRPAGQLKRIFASPGPIYDPEGERPDWWRFARALHAAGFRAGEIVHNCFAYHFTPAGSMIETGAHALGCAVFPGGVGNTELQVRAIADLKPAGYGGTPSFLKIILEKAAELGTPLPSLKKALVSGEALPPTLRGWFAERGVAVLQCYATADLGLIAYESAPDGGLILDEQVIVEIVRPGTGDPVPAGEVGEVVVTSFNADYPLTRFATGDLSAFLPGQSACGRTGLRLKGWLGRADQTAKIKGMFVHPAQVAEVLKRHGLAKGRLTVEKDGDIDMAILTVETADPSLSGAVTETFQALCKLRASVLTIAPGSLPNDGKVIDDQRPVG